MIILGIDPGSNVTGFGVIELGEKGEETLIDCGVIRVSGIQDGALRLKQIYESITQLIDIHKPDLCGVEMPVYGNNPQSMLKLGRAQATAMLAALNHQIPVSEYSPKQVKKALTGNGNASKDQVRYMVQTILSMDVTINLGLDASDALAIALCHAHRMQHRGDKPAYRNWDAFVKANPGRIR